MDKSKETQYIVLCVGLNDVQLKKWRPLLFAESNAHLATQYFDVLKDSHVTELIGTKALKSSIISWVRESNDAPPGTIVILYFSGRASAEKFSDSPFYQRCLWLHNPGPQIKKTEDQESHEIPDSHFIKIQEILDLHYNSKQQIIIVIDACYQVPMNISVPRIFEEFKKTENVKTVKPYIITSSITHTQEEFEDSQLKSGVFTHYFLRILSGKYSFFLLSHVSSFKLLDMLNRKINAHTFTGPTGRKRELPSPLKRDLIPHLSGKSIKLPILEPRPLIIHPGTSSLCQNISTFIHFFSRTRLRIKIVQALGLFLFFFSLFFVISDSLVRVHFRPYADAALYFPFRTNYFITLADLNPERGNKRNYQSFSIYPFKHNWQASLMKVLDEDGKIILSGNLLGIPITGVSKQHIINYALSNSHKLMYWDPVDVREILITVGRLFVFFNNQQKHQALQLFASLGRNGKLTAWDVFDLKKEANQDLRNTFWDHFYSPDWLKKNSEYLTPYDYLHLIKSNYEIPKSIAHAMQQKTDIFLSKIAASLPDSQVTNEHKKKSRQIYKQLRTLAIFGSRLFRNKAPFILQKMFSNEEVMDLVWASKNISDKKWLLELYFKQPQVPDTHNLFWRPFVFHHLSDASPREKAVVLKFLLNNDLERVPRKYWGNVVWHLQYVDRREIVPEDWFRWLNRYPFDAMQVSYIFSAFINKDYENVFSYLNNNFQSFRNCFIGSAFQRLYQFNPEKTLQLAKNIAENGTPSDRLHAAVFLYNNNCPEYATFIIWFLEQAKDNQSFIWILETFSGDINKALIKIIGNDLSLKPRLKPLLTNPRLLYRLFQTNLNFWPTQLITRIKNHTIPPGYIKGWPFLKMCEKLPDSFRNQQFTRIWHAPLEDGFRWRFESIFAQHYPRQFLQLVFNENYKWGRHTPQNIIKAYNAFSLPQLKHQLLQNLQRERYWNVGYICEAMITKMDKKKEALTKEEIREILETYNHPVQRIQLRKLRFFLHMRQTRR